MGPPFNLTPVQKNISDFIISTYFGMKNPLPTIICSPGVIAENPKVYLQLISVYGSIFGAITSLVALGYSIKYSITFIKKIIKKKKHRPLKPLENKFINDVAKDTKHNKKVTKKNITKFVERRSKGKKLSSKQKKVLSTVLRKKRISKFGKNLSLEDELKTKIKVRSEGKNFKTSMKGSAARTFGASGGEGMQEISDLKKYLMEQYINPFKARIKKLNKIVQKFGKRTAFGGSGWDISKGLYYGAVSLYTTPACFAKLDSFKTFMLKRLMELDSELSMLEGGKEQKINHEIYNKDYKLDKLSVAGSFIGDGGFGGVCRSNINKAKRQILEVLKDISKRIVSLEQKELEQDKSAFGKRRKF